MRTRMISIGGRACDPRISQRPTSIRPGRTGAWAVGPPVCGTETDGIGRHRLMPILSFRATESSSTRSAGGSTHHGVRTRLRTLAMDTDTAVTVTAVTITAVSATLVTSGPDTVRDTQLVVASPDPLDTPTALAEELSADFAVAEPSAVAASAAAAAASAVAAVEASAVVEV